MQVTINLDHTALDNLGITIEQFEQAASAALTNLTHPESGAPIYCNDVRVIVIADCAEIEQLLMQFPPELRTDETRKALTPVTRD